MTSAKHITICSIDININCKCYEIILNQQKRKYIYIYIYTVKDDWWNSSQLDTMLQCRICQVCKQLTYFARMFPLFKYVPVFCSKCCRLLENIKINQNIGTLYVNPLNANPTKWSHTLKQFIGNLQFFPDRLSGMWKRSICKTLVKKCFW